MRRFLVFKNFERRILKLKNLSRAFRFLFLGMLLISFVACGNEKSKNLENEKFEIVSLAPSNTEILVGLSLGENIIGIDEYSKDVEGVRSDAKIFESGVPNIEALAQMDPDIVFLSQYDPSISFDKLEGLGIKIVNIDTASSLNEIYESILLIGRETNKEDEAKKLVENTKMKTENILNKISGESPRIYFEISQAPYIYSFGKETFINEILEISGGENIFGDLSGWIAPNSESIIEKNPEIIFTNVNLEGNIDEIKNRSGWENIDAVKNGEIYYIDKNNSSRPSQFFVNALESIHKHIEDFKNDQKN